MAQGRKEQDDSLRHSHGRWGRVVACGVNIIYTGQSAGTILTECNYAGTAKNNYFSLSDK